MDPVSTAAAMAARAVDPTAAEAAKVGGRLLERLVGPSVDALGLQWADRLRERNLVRLLRKTQAREGENPGTVSTRLAAQVFEAAQYADNEMVAEYLSGVLASSRAEGGGSDGGISWSALIARLSSDQLALHFQIYSSVREPLIYSQPENANKLHSVEVLIPLDELWESLNYGERGDVRLADAVDGLMREGLIGDGYAYGGMENVAVSSPQHGARLIAPFERGFRVIVSIHGIRLFLWGLGHGQGSIEQYIDPGVILEPAESESALATVTGAGIYQSFWEQTPLTPTT